MTGLVELTPTGWIVVTTYHLDEEEYGQAALAALPGVFLVIAKGDEALKLVVPKKRWFAPVRRSFDGEPSAITLAEDLIVYRHWGGEAPEIGSLWFSPKSYSRPGNARRYLALPANNTAERVTAFRIKKGTTILYGKVAGQKSKLGFGSYATGGGIQIYVPDPFRQAFPIR
ncbi:MAG: hypothetical protein KDA86_13155 [Planctomycetaceae bacterium]|nr:hypothetical protein [Planctomycetaceae bacterium]